MFFEPGGATRRAVHLVRELLYPTAAGTAAARVERGDTP
jgi:hypothetical protein